MSLFEAVAVYYAVVSVITLVVYAWDKRASKRPGAGRVRERTLHLWTLAGGFVGALIGQSWLRHKTKHPSFIVLTWVALIVHAAAWAWWWTRSGASPLKF
jgi:uncharacterized membrane protein YsdA (DUF1294 family)